MAVDITTEKRFEEDITAFFLSPAGGYINKVKVHDQNYRKLYNIENFYDIILIN